VASRVPQVLLLAWPGSKAVRELTLQLLWELCFEQRAKTSGELSVEAIALGSCSEKTHGKCEALVGAVVVVPLALLLDSIGMPYEAQPAGAFYQDASPQQLFPMAQSFE